MSTIAKSAEHRGATFAEDVAFLSKHTSVIVLESPDEQAQVAVAPAYQGRVMTSTARGSQGASYGYVHRAGVEAGARQPHMTVLGGEDRFWLGPEGGQYALYFAPGAPFEFEHWHVPEPIDWGAWPVVARSEREVTFAQSMTLINYAGTRFSLRVERTIRLLAADALTGLLGTTLPREVHVVAYESDNRITNTGEQAWTRDSGLVSIWILGMFKPAPRATVVVPYVTGPESERGRVVNDAYFGAISPDRLAVREHAVFLRGDGASRGKIGLSRTRARDVLGSYDPEARSLTLVQYTLPADETEYVSSMWEHQSEPYAGDVVNSYNDGPPKPGAPPLGPFYELETSSPAAALAPSESMRHVHRTIHVEGPERELDAIAQRVLGVTLDEISGAFAR